MRNCIIEKSAIGRYKITFYTPSCNSGYGIDCSTSLMPFRERLAVYTNLFDQLDSQIAPRDYSEEACHRAKLAVIDYGENNIWTYFVTLTFDRKKVIRDDSMLLYKKVRKACNHYRSRVDPDFRYILCPELHSDGIHIHFHGLFYVSSDNLDITGPYKGFNRKSNRSFDYFRSSYFFRRFGAVTLEPVATSPLFVSAYMTKYITKQQFLLFGNRYICSQGLHRSQQIYFADTRESVQQVKERLFSNSFFIPVPVTNSEYATTYLLDETQYNTLFGDYVMR